MSNRGRGPDIGLARIGLTTLNNPFKCRGNSRARV